MTSPVERVDDRDHWLGQQLDDQYGARIGTVDGVLVDEETDLRWIVVNLARFGRRITLAPAEGAIDGNGHVWIPVARDAVRSAPRALAQEPWREGAFRSLMYRHYGVRGGSRRTRHDRRTGPPERRAEARDAGVGAPGGRVAPWGAQQDRG